ncbi:hypothetical protein BGX27_003174, partial [Mortierella sp. AM989]
MARIEAFRERWAEYNEVMDFIEKNYFDETKMERWMLCYRQDVSYANIDTNNYIESWHNTLKRHFFKDNRIQRPDRVIHTLAKIALPHYQRKCMLQNLGVGRMTPAQKKARDSQFRAIEQLRRCGNNDGDVLLGTALPNVLAVKSFADPGRVYNMEMDFSKRELGHFTSCTCPDFFQSKMICKHISLAMLVIPFIEFEYRGNWEVPADFEPVESVAHEEPVRENIPPVDMLEIYSEKIQSYIQARDRSVPLPEHLHKEAELYLKKVYSIFKDSLVLK